LSLSVVYSIAQDAGLKKSREWIAEKARQQSSDPNHGGRKTLFAKGGVSWNKGKKGLYHPNSAATYFKKGHVPHNKCKVGDVRKPADYWKVKIAEPNAWEFCHIFNWRKAHGEIPPGLCVSFRDGNINNYELENLELLTKAELFQKHWIHNLPEDLKEVIYTLGSLKRRINHAKKQTD
jgi:hypothetical protein